MSHEELSPEQTRAMLEAAKKLAGGKSPAEVQAELAAGIWPFTLTPDEMRAKLAERSTPTDIGADPESSSG